VSYLWYADRVMEFPLGVFAISFATVILPQLSEHAADKNTFQFKSSFLEGLSMIYFINFPATVGLIVLANLIIAVLFQHGHFSEQSTLMTAQTLQCFALGLPFVSGTRITSSAFYALQDSKTPVKAANLAVFANILMGLILLKPLGHRGLALGVAFGSFSNFLMQMYDFRKKMGPLGLKKLQGSVLKMIGASLGMGVCLYFSQIFIRGHLSSSTLGRLTALIILMMLGLGIYAFFAWLLRIQETKHFLAILQSRIKPAAKRR